ncbi:MATE family efflux transporter [Leptospira sp. GIMC2001]|uniref:MATE family efflux transporter n=1 Tax=Leptospira sp. GIMC2001 TaxID=1513297 RepID=UPI00234B17C8|nr:MATE family efflux transporter [Leptospira sp. GIMC2001]WCL49869.1 MATE family efflux transporter [Leptospira sp. GIMC2001]
MRKKKKTTDSIHEIRESSELSNEDSILIPNPIPVQPELQKGKFVTGSIWRHVIVMSLTASVGLIAIFFVDLVDIYFLSILGESEIAAAVGFAGAILFFMIALSIGLSITMTALVSKSLGSGNRARAIGWMANVYLLIVYITVPISIVVWIFIPELLSMIGAEGKVLSLGMDYLRIIVPSSPILALAMGSGAVLRAIGDAKRSMFSTMGGAIVNAVLDPIFIFYFELGIEGAAVATVCSRFAILAIALHPLYHLHKMFDGFHFNHFRLELREMMKIFFPAALTNLATPIGNAYVMFTIAAFGESAVAGMSVIGRLAPVAFAVVFASSGAVGPIIGQNFGAERFDRLMETLTKSYYFVFGYVVFISIVLYAMSDWIADWFYLEDSAREIVILFCKYISITFSLNGAMFVSNAAYNNLGLAKYSTYFNFAKATIFTIPFVYFGSIWWNAPGVIFGQAIGASIIGAISILFSYKLIQNLIKKL